MGCFSTCFRKSNRRRRSRKPANPTPCTDQFLQRYECVEAVQPADVKEQENTETLIYPNPDSIDDERNEELTVSGRKKVTFDLNVQFYGKLPATDENHGNEEEEEEEEEEKTEESEKEKENNCSSSSQIPFPKKYRYQNCRDSDDDEIDEEMLSYDDSDHDYMGDDEDEESEVEVSNNSLVGSDESSLSSSMESVNEKLATTLYSSTPIQVKDTKITDEIKGFESVLHPVENLSQWKEIRGMAKLEPQNMAAKENNMNTEPVMKPNLTNKIKSKNSCEEMMAVDTSLSSWLNKSIANSVSVGNSLCSGGKSCSAKDYEDRPILGVLTVEEIRQFSATSTPRRSPTRSPDDMPIIGSVGSYWN